MSSIQTLPTTKRSRKIPFILLFCLGMAVLLVKLLLLPLHEDAGGVGAMFDIVSLAPNSSVKETEAVVDKVNGLKTDLISQNVHIKTTRHDSLSTAQPIKITSLMLWLDLLFTMLFIVLLVWLLVSWKTALMTLVFFPVMVASSISLFWFSEISVNALLTLSGLIAVLLSVIIFWFSGFRYLQALLRAIVFVMVSVLLFSLVINSYTNHIESLLTMETPQDIYIAIDLPENTQSEKTAKLTQKIGEELANIPEIISIQSYTGEVQQNSTRNKPWFADIDVTLDDTEIDTRSNKEVQQDIRNKITPLVQAADAKIQIIEGL